MDWVGFGLAERNTHDGFQTHTSNKSFIDVIHFESLSDTSKGTDVPQSPRWNVCFSIGRHGNSEGRLFCDRASLPAYFFLSLLLLLIFYEVFCFVLSTLGRKIEKKTLGPFFCFYLFRAGAGRQSYVSHKVCVFEGRASPVPPPRLQAAPPVRAGHDAAHGESFPFVRVWSRVPFLRCQWCRSEHGGP